MRGNHLADLDALAIVAEERNFTRAAVRLGMSQSALSHAMRRLEARVGVRLLARTTRSVAPTAAGERLLRKVVPAFSEINAEIAALGELRETLAGTIRITTSKHAAKTVVWPKLAVLLPHHPQIEVELSIDSGLTDIVAGRFDAGVRLGEAVARDMIAVPISPQQRMAVVGSPAYLLRNPPPQNPADLSRHRCVNQRRVTSGSMYNWELERDGREVRARVEGQVTFDDDDLLLQAALDGFGLAFVMEDYALAEIANGRLVRVLEDWCPPFAGYYLYYPSRRQPSAAFSLIVETLRHRA
jgi:DNA-binding transcriptional LysR family regulator